MTKEPIIRHVSSILAGTWGDESDDSVNTVACLRIADFDYSRLTNVDPQTRRKISQADIIQKILKNDDILIEKSGGGEKTPVGRAIVVTNIKQPTTYANFIERVRFKPSLDSKYANYVLSHLYSRKINTKYIKQNTGIQNLDVKAYLSEPIAIPDIKEQEKAVNYLNSKTQTLDKILTAKNHTHAHLSELRQAIITNAVLGTGGAAMNLQDTNIPWIGKIPVHWQMRKLKDIATVSIGWTPSTSNPEYFEGENVWVTIADMNKKYITGSKAQISDIAVLDAGIKKVPKGSLLYSFKLSVGKVAFAGTDLYTNEAIAAIIPKKDTEIDNDFLYYALSSYMISNANENIYGAKLLNQGLIKNAVIAVPPVEEQRKIAKTLNQKLDKIDHASGENQKSISQLEEYRSSLISNVVGGKVEV